MRVFSQDEDIQNALNETDYARDGRDPTAGEPAPGALSTDLRRKRKNERDYDSIAMDPHDVKRNIAMPKPYMLKAGMDVYGDKIRIFAKCMNGGRPYDHVDLMLMTQSL